ncbi:MAG TPA: helix-turn-helix domain-containing protein [Thermoleophilaceae bacterium]|jgi:DNA-binding HxlR family transcriptional regulator
MGRNRYGEMTCSIARTMEVVGDAWAPLVLRDVALGITRFDVLQRDLGVSRKVLSRRLDDLVESGVLTAVPYQHNPPRHDYLLTEKGADLVTVLIAMQRWGDRWVFGEGGAPVVLRHEGCGAATAAVLTCAACGEELRPGEVTALPGPGLRDGPGTFEAAPRVRANAERLHPSESPLG